MSFDELDRPRRNRRRISDPDLNWDTDVEEALRTTLTSGKAISLPLWRFHSSPAKGRLWRQGYKVVHRALPDRQTVAAWLEPEAKAA